MKKIIYVVVGIIFIALIGRVIWAYQQVKSEQVQVTSQVVSTSTSISEVKSDTFTTTQLENLKTDLVAFYLKYENNDETAKNTEPLQSQIFKEMDAIFLKNLGVVTRISADDFGSAAIFLQPEVADIILDIETQYGKPKNVPVAVVPTSKIVISNLSHSSVSISDLGKHATKALTFDVTNVGLAKELCVVMYITYLDDPKNHPLNSPNTLCNPYYSDSKSGYSNTPYFSNLLSLYSGGYDGTSRNYFEIEGIDNVTLDHYLKDTSGKESNRLLLTIKGTAKSTSTQSTTPPAVSTIPISSASPTAKITANGLSNLRINAGEKVTYVWTSTNADSFSGTNSISGCLEAAKEGAKEGLSTSSGSATSTIPTRFSGCTIITTQTARNTKTGQQATATTTIRVN